MDIWASSLPERWLLTSWAMTEGRPCSASCLDSPSLCFPLPSPVQQCHLLNLWPLMTFLMRPYIQKRPAYIYVLFILFTITGRWGHWDSGGGKRDSTLDHLPLSLPPGLFSMYFHMTLSFLGQMLDEITILWLLASGYSLWLPRVISLPPRAEQVGRGRPSVNPTRAHLSFRPSLESLPSTPQGPFPDPAWT